MLDNLQKTSRNKEPNEKCSKMVIQSDLPSTSGVHVLHSEDELVRLQYHISSHVRHDGTSVYMYAAADCIEVCHAEAEENAGQLAT